MDGMTINHIVSIDHGSYRQLILLHRISDRGIDALRAALREGHEVPTGTVDVTQCMTMSLTMVVS